MATADSGGGDGAEADQEAEVVVMRKPRNVLGPSERQMLVDSQNCAAGACEGGEGKKRVKWSESTDLREKLKVYRRSQLDMPLNYHHIALEEAREKEGVKKWRDSLLRGTPLADADDRRPSILSLVARATGGAGDDDSDSDAEAASGEAGETAQSSDATGDGDEELEKQLLIIRSKTTKYTILPAYTAAIVTYKDYLSSSKNTKGLPDEKVSGMKEQLKIYQKVVKVYKDWGDQSDDTSGHFDQISSLLQEAADLGTPPQPVAQTISDQLADATNVKHQVDNYNRLVQDLLNARGC